VEIEFWSCDSISVPVQAYFINSDFDYSKVQSSSQRFRSLPLVFDLSGHTTKIPKQSTVGTQSSGVSIIQI
jgi:hypothetical protein